MPKRCSDFRNASDDCFFWVHLTFIPIIVDLPFEYATPTYSNPSIWGFPEIGAPPNHPLSWNFPWNKASILGFPIYGNSQMPSSLQTTRDLAPGGFPGGLQHTSLTGLVGDPGLVDMPTTPRRWRPGFCPEMGMSFEKSDINGNIWNPCIFGINIYC